MTLTAAQLQCNASQGGRESVSLPKAFNYTAGNGFGGSASVSASKHTRRRLAAMYDHCCAHLDDSLT